MMHLDRLVESESFGGMMPVPEELKSIASELERDGLGVGVITQTDYVRSSLVSLFQLRDCSGIEILT